MLKYYLLLKTLEQASLNNVSLYFTSKMYFIIFAKEFPFCLSVLIGFINILIQKRYTHLVNGLTLDFEYQHILKEYNK